MMAPNYAVMSREIAADLVMRGVPYANGRVPVAIGLIDNEMAVLLFSCPGDNFWPCTSYNGCKEYATFDLRDAEVDD